VQIILGLHLAAAQGPESKKFDSFLGCYRDDGARDLKKFGGNLKSIAKCRAWATKKKLKYFAMQWGVQCFGDNSFGSPRNKYYQHPLQTCTRHDSRRRHIYSCGEPEFHAYCGGNWVNAMYLTKPVVDHNLKVNKPMQLLSPWRMGWCAYLSNNWNIRMYVCYANNDQMKKDSHWMFDKYQRLKLWYGRKRADKDSRCWDHHTGNNNLYFHRCHNGNNQKWYFGTRNVIHNKWRKRSNCLDWHMTNNNLYMGGCHSGVNQQFWWNTGTKLEIKGGVGYFRGRRFLRSNGKKYLSYKKQVNGISIPSTFLHSAYMNLNFQTFKFVKVGKDWYNIMATNCIYEPDSTRGGYYLPPNMCSDCNHKSDGNYKSWKHPHMHRRRTIWNHFTWNGGFTLDNSYMSVNSAGTQVDWWPVDDGSGRQRWKIKGPLAGGGYNIIVAGGVRGKRKYLSTTKSGNKVDLWIKDDNSGRQKWKLTGDLVPTPKPTPKPTPRPTPVPVKNLLSGGGWKIVKGKRKCTISIENGVKYPCAVSPNYPKRYSSEVTCEISMKNTKWVYFKGSSERYFDYLTVSGKQYSGKLSGKKVAVRGNIKWTADFFEATKGWKVCKGKKPRLNVLPKKWKKTRITIGRSRRNVKCVRGPGVRVLCPRNAGNRGKRVNSDYRNAGDRFSFRYRGNNVCAKRIDHRHGWGMNLQIICKKKIR